MSDKHDTPGRFLAIETCTNDNSPLAEVTVLPMIEVLPGDGLPDLKTLKPGDEPTYEKALQAIWARAGVVDEPLSVTCSRESAGDAGRLLAAGWYAEQAKKELLGLKKKDLHLLAALAQVYPRPLIQVDLQMMLELETGADKKMSRRTIGRALDRLRARGLTWKPAGDRGGDALTPVAFAAVQGNGIGHKKSL
jgi:hypothetical protein